MKVRRAIDMPLSTNTIFARDGAWDRKYQVRKVLNADDSSAVVVIEFIGHHFSDGRVQLPRRKAFQVMELRLIRGTWCSKGIGLCFWDKGLSFDNRYVQVQKVR